MLSVNIQKDVAEYKPKIVAGLTARSLICSVSAILISVLVAVYFYFVLGLGYDVAMYAVIIVSIPIWAAGFWHPCGMPFEKFVPLFIKHKLCNQVVLYQPSYKILIEEATGEPFEMGPRAEVKKMKDETGQVVSKVYANLCKRPDFEVYEPSTVFEEKQGGDMNE